MLKKYLLMIKWLTKFTDIFVDTVIYTNAIRQHIQEKIVSLFCEWAPVEIQKIMGISHTNNLYGVGSKVKVSFGLLLDQRFFISNTNFFIE